MISSTTSLDDLFDIVKTTLPAVNAGEIFIVKDLFRGFEWNRIEKGKRTKLGSKVFAWANNEGSSVIQPLDKTPQNQQRYKKL